MLMNDPKQPMTHPLEEYGRFGPPGRVLAPRPEEWDYSKSIGAPKRIPAGFEGKPWDCDTCGDTKVLMVREDVQYFTTRKPFYPCPDCTVSPQVQRVQESMGVPPLYLGQTFANTDKGYIGHAHGPRLGECYTFCYEWAQRKHDETKWIVLTGDPGCGKSRLGAIILRERYERFGQAGRWMSFVGYLDALKQTFGVEGDHTAATIIKAAQEAPLLIIDDLGVEKSTAWAQERGYALLAYRYDNKLETVVTTNVSIETLQPRLWDRLMHQRDDYSKLWDLSGLPSYRSRNVYLGTPTTRTTR
jgi:hypothetical protein